MLSKPSADGGAREEGEHSLLVACFHLVCSCPTNSPNKWMLSIGRNSSHKSTHTMAIELPISVMAFWLQVLGHNWLWRR
jgi:hypothetical protein